MEEPEHLNRSEGSSTVPVEDERAPKEQLLVCVRLPERGSTSRCVPPCAVRPVFATGGRGSCQRQSDGNITRVSRKRAISGHFLLPVLGAKEGRKNGPGLNAGRRVSLAIVLLPKLGAADPRICSKGPMKANASSGAQSKALDEAREVEHHKQSAHV